MTIAEKYDVPKKFYDANKIVPGLILFVLIVALPSLYTCASGGAKARPEIQKANIAAYNDGELNGCVEDADYMRSYHMDLLDQWRDTAIRDGKRIFISERWGDAHPIEISLSNTCIGCHDSKEDFCDKCHTYAGVDPYCWSCHVIPGGEK